MTSGAVFGDVVKELQFTDFPLKSRHRNVDSFLSNGGSIGTVKDHLFHQNLKVQNHELRTVNHTELIILYICKW